MPKPKNHKNPWKKPKHCTCCGDDQRFLSAYTLYKDGRMEPCGIVLSCLKGCWLGPPYSIQGDRVLVKATPFQEEGTALLAER